ncbi:hypothetical protein [Bacillus sp. OAE603]|uniref:hypothetical protein n=1 Tax=Gottfriedia sp. OAE603 TaxID=2663872 RepID=UPI00178B7118
MDKQFALHIANQIDDWMKSNQSLYEIQKIETNFNTLMNFQQWANGKPVIAAYHLQKIEEENYYLLLIDWHRNDQFYLVIYVGNKSTTAAEIREVKNMNGKDHLVWKYNPLKRDGKNAERKAYFKQVFGSLFVEIPLPETKENVEDFFQQIYQLCRNRQKADRITDVFNF